MSQLYELDYSSVPGAEIAQVANDTQTTTEVPNQHWGGFDVNNADLNAIAPISVVVLAIPLLATAYKAIHTEGN